jgi:hypothetical protein
MSIWFKDTETYDGARSATRSGMYASLGFGAMLVIGIVVLLVSNGALLGAENLDPMERMVGTAFICAELAVALFAAFRFRMGKGLVAGSAALLIFVIEIGMKIFSGPFVGVLWYVVYLAIFLGLINGIRGALALRQMGDAVEVGETFQ